MEPGEIQLLNSQFDWLDLHPFYKASSSAASFGCQASRTYSGSLQRPSCSEGRYNCSGQVPGTCRVLFSRRAGGTQAGSAFRHSPKVPGT